VIGELGQVSLCFALALSLVLAASGLMGAAAPASVARRVATSSAMGMLVFVALAFGVLTYAFVTSDFSVALVANHSHTLKPLVYKISGVWGNHEGSMLLWVLVLALYAAMVAGFKRGGERLTSAALGVQGLVAAAFLLFIVFTSNPFMRLDPSAFRRRRSHAAAAGSRIGAASADALHRLCRAFRDLLLCRRGASGWRSGDCEQLGPGGAAFDPDCLGSR
jgi:cytochrome c-type biogenesis protein CcmF